MCHIWQNPTLPNKEISIDILRKLPQKFDYLNLTGGEPTLRDDLEEIVDVLYNKTKKLEISTNGLKSQKLIRIVKKYNDIKIRISLDGIRKNNDIIRGEVDGYEKKINTMKLLINSGGKDLGFAITFQDENAHDIIGVLNLAEKYKVELATSSIHNAFQFHKNDNYLYDRIETARNVEKLIFRMLKSWNVKNWFRAYLNQGLFKKILGYPRIHVCTQGTDSVFIDPWGDVYACNVRNDLLMGNIITNTWEDIYNSKKANNIRKLVSNCDQNCWMVSSAKTSIRNKRFYFLPKFGVVTWVIINKVRSIVNLKPRFNDFYNNMPRISQEKVVRRTSYLVKSVKRNVQVETNYYKSLNRYNNN